MPNKKKKRTNTEMSFSPEQVQMDKTITAQEMFKDKEYFKDLLREILDEKFREYLQPVKENIAALEIKVNEIDNKHSERINKLVEENRRLKDEIVKLEGYQRKNNCNKFYCNLTFCKLNTYLILTNAYLVLWRQNAATNKNI